MAETLQLDPAKTAVVLIEYQNDFTSDGGALHGAVAAVMDKTGMLDNTVALVDAARAAGVDRSCTRRSRSPPGYGEITAPPVRDPQGRRRRQRVRQGHVGRGDRRRPGARPRATSSSRASAGSTRSPARTSTSSCAARASRPSRSAGSSPTAASSRRCAARYENGYRVITLTDCVAATSPGGARQRDRVRLPDVLAAGRVEPGDGGAVGTARRWVRRPADRRVRAGRVAGAREARHCCSIIVRQQ